MTTPVKPLRFVYLSTFRTLGSLLALRYPDRGGWRIGLYADHSTQGGSEVGGFGTPTGASVAKGFALKPHFLNSGHSAILPRLRDIQTRASAAAKPTADAHML